jgi:hypothetical protein
MPAVADRENRRLIRRGALPLVTHGLVEYVEGILFLAAPFVLDFQSEAAPTILSILIGAGLLVLAVMTDYPPGLVRSLPVASHVVIDYVLAIFLVVSPFVLGFSDESNALALFIIVGVAHLLMTVATRFRRDDERRR